MSSFTVSSHVVGNVLNSLKDMHPHDLSWKEVAEHVGLQPAVLSAIKSGTRPLSAANAEKLGNLFGLSRDELFEKIYREECRQSLASRTKDYATVGFVGEQFFARVEDLLEEADVYQEYVIVAGQRPIEMKGADAIFVDGVIKALRNGKHITYVLPKRPTSNELSAFDTSILLSTDIRYLEDDFRLWKKGVLLNYPEPSDTKLINDNLTCVAVPVSTTGAFLFAPYIKYVLRRIPGDSTDKNGNVVDAWVQVSEAVADLNTEVIVSDFKPSTGDETLIKLSEGAAKVLNGIYESVKRTS